MKTTRYLSIFLLCLPLYAEAPKVVEVDSVKRGDIQRTTTLIGTIKAKKSVVLVAHTSGILAKTILSGETLKRGDVIATLENKDATTSLGLVQQAEIISKDQYERMVLMNKAQAANKKEVEEFKNQWLTAQINLLNAKAELDKTQFKAPFDGVVGHYKAREGSQLQPGDQVISFYDPSTMIVEFDIPAHALFKLKSPHEISVEGKTYMLNSVPRIVDPETYMAPAHCDIECKECFVGEVTNVILSLETRTNVLLLPTKAVFLKDGNKVVYVVRNGKTCLSEVKTGLQEKESIEVTQGLEEGDLVVIRQQARLYDDTEVSIAEKRS